MEESKASSLQQQKQMTQQQQQMTQQMTQQQQQHLQQQQQQLLLFQQLQRQKQQQQQDAMSRFPSNIDVHLRPQSFLHRPINPQSQTPNPTNPKMPNQLASPPQGQQRHPPNPANHLAVNSFSNSNPSNTSNSNHQQQQQQDQQQPKVARANPAELQLAYQDAWRVCHPDFKRPFSSLEDACERLLPYHVVADYEAEEDDKILDSDTTGQMLSRSQQWDHNIAAKVAEFTATFEKQVLAFNIISRKRALGEFRTEEKLMLEQLMLQEEKRALFELRSEMMGRDNHEANLRMVRARAEQASGESQVHREMVGAPIRANAYGSQVSNVPQGQEGNHGEMNNGWGSNQPNNDKEPSEDFLNDEETENGDTGTESEWRAGGELDLNAR